MVILALIGMVVIGAGGFALYSAVRPTKKMVDLLSTEVSNRVNNGLLKEFEALASVDALQDEKVKLIDAVAKLKAERDADAIRFKAEKEAQQEEFVRKERELTHRAGLLAIQHDAELDLHKQRAELTAQREVIEIHQKAITEQSAFQRERFEQEVKGLRDLLAGMQEQLQVIAVPGANKVRVDA